MHELDDRPTVDFSFDMPEGAVHRPSAECWGCVRVAIEDLQAYADGLNDDDPARFRAMAALSGWRSVTAAVSHEFDLPADDEPPFASGARI